MFSRHVSTISTVLLCVFGSCFSHPLLGELELVGIKIDPTISRTVKFGMMVGFGYSGNNCAKNWTHWGEQPEIMHILASYSGNTDGCVHVEMGEIFPNGTVVGGIQELLTGKIDVYGATVYPDIAPNSPVQYLYPYSQKNICLMVPRRALTYGIAPPTVSIAVWASIFVCLAPFVIGLRLKCGVTLWRALFDVTQTFLTGLFDARRPLRLLLLCLSLFSFFMMNCFAGAFVGSLTAPNRDSEFDTLEEVNDNVQDIYSTNEVADIILQLSREDSSIVSAMSRKLRFKDLKSKWLNILYDVARTKGGAILAPESILEIMRLNREASKDGYCLYHRVQECMVAPAYQAFPVRKGWSQRDRFSAMLQHVQEAGIIQKIQERDLQRISLIWNYTRPESGLPPLLPQPLSLAHLEMPFVLWLVGLSATAAVFGGELLFCRKKPSA